MSDIKDFSSVYRIFNIDIDSNIPLPELSRITHCAPLISNLIFRLTNLPSTSMEEPNWFHHWYDEQKKSEITISVARQNGQYLLRFPELADFMLDLKNARIQCCPSLGIPVKTIRHLLLDQVIPRFIGQLGNLVLHASAIALSNGSCIAFLGKSGWGKSTIASSFYQNRAKLITDDSILLEEENGRLIGIPAYAGSRLWRDSADIVFPDCPELLPVTHYSDKKKLILREQADFPKRELQAIFLLNNPSEDTGLSDIKIESLAGAEMIMTLLRQTFLVDIKDMGVISKQFNIANHITQTSTAFYSLSYPRIYDQLADLRTAILTVVSQTLADKRNNQG